MSRTISIIYNFLFFGGSGIFAVGLTSPYYCANMTPQSHINIEQLMGMWYGIEIYQHDPEEEHYVRVEPSCPIIHISEDKSFYTTTYNPLYRDYDNSYNYGMRKDYNRDRDRDQQNRYQQNGHRPHYRYNQDSSGTTIYTRRYGTTNNDYMRRLPNDTKYLRVYWDENGGETEYRVKYKLNDVGFWQSSGPQNGSELEPQYSRFAGTIQVLKAVGSHLVLNLCHQLPERKLKTILLARETKLESVDIHGVHNLLNRRGLSTSNIKKVCSTGSQIYHFNLSIIIVVSLVNFYGQLFAS